jgi:hypothetical protein
MRGVFRPMTVFAMCVVTVAFRLPPDSAHQIVATWNDPVSVCVQEFSPFLQADKGYLLSVKSNEANIVATLQFNDRDLRPSGFSPVGTCQWLEIDQRPKQVRTTMVPSFIEALNGFRSNPSVGVALKSALEVALKMWPTIRSWTFNFGVLPQSRKSVADGISAQPLPETYSFFVVGRPAATGQHFIVHVREDGKVLAVMAGL